MEPKRTQKNGTSFQVSNSNLFFIYLYVNVYYINIRIVYYINIYVLLYTHLHCTIVLVLFFCLGDVSWTYQIELDDLRYLSP